MKKLLRIATVAGLITALAPVSHEVQAAGMVTVKGTAPQGYSLLMVGKTGNSTAVKSGKFSLKMTAAAAKGATLHLVSAAGKYAGPVVLKFSKSAKTGNTLLSGKAGDLGKIAMKTGYAIAAAKSTSAISTSAKIKVSSAGAPSGAGRLGLPSATGGASLRVFGVQQLGDGNAPSGEDTDKDGLPNTLDIDDDNDAKIDLVDDTNPSKAITTGSLLFLDISKTINLNAGMDEAKMQAAIDAVFASNNNFWIGLFMNTQGGTTPDGMHISCADEVKWCAPSTPATLFGAGMSNGAASQKWADKKSDGFALGIPKGNGPNCDDTAQSTQPMCTGPTTNFNRQFIPQLPSADVQPGSLFTLNMTTGGVITGSTAGTLSPYFASVPALKEVEAGGQVRTIDYSLKSVNGAGGAWGTQGNPIVVPASNKTIKLTFWHPQRSGVAEAGESKYVDMGGLRYGFYVGVNKVCDTGAIKPLSPTLTDSPSSGDFGHIPLVDSSKDQAPAATNILSFSVDISKCEGGAAPMIGNNAQMVTLIASSPANSSIKAYQDFYIKVQ